MVLRIWYTSIYVQMYNTIANTPVLHMCLISRIHGLLLNTHAMLSCEHQGTHPTRQLYFLGTLSRLKAHVYTLKIQVIHMGYLTIRPAARKGYVSIAHEEPNGLLTCGP